MEQLSKGLQTFAIIKNSITFAIPTIIFLILLFFYIKQIIKKYKEVKPGNYCPTNPPGHCLIYNPTQIFPPFLGVLFILMLFFGMILYFSCTNKAVGTIQGFSSITS